MAMGWWLSVIAAVAVVIVLHRVALQMAEKGWIYYGPHQAPPGSGSLAAMQMMEVFKPELRHTIEEHVVGDLRTFDDELGELDLPPD